jgi:hypothetical protein
MAPREEEGRLALLQGTLDLLILRTLVFGPQHGQGIAQSIQQTSQDALLVEHGALSGAAKAGSARMACHTLGHFREQQESSLL